MPKYNRHGREKNHKTDAEDATKQIVINVTRSHVKVGMFINTDTLPTTPFDCKYSAFRLLTSDSDAGRLPAIRFPDKSR